MSPAGRNPLSASMSHSKPSDPVAKVAEVPGARVATEVFRQNRIWPNADGTEIPRFEGPLTMNIVPLSAFSGRPPSEGGLNLGSRQVPVHMGVGSIFALAEVSL